MFQADPRTGIVGLCDLISERLDGSGDGLGISARFTDLDAMIAETHPDIVAIATGREFHYDLAMRALEHGVNIDVEKPMCVDLEQADAVMAKAKEKGARVAVHHQASVGVNMRVMARALEDGRIGQLRYINASSQGYYGDYGILNVGGHLLSDITKVAIYACSVVATATPIRAFAVADRSKFAYTFHILHQVRPVAGGRMIGVDMAMQRQ